VVVTGFDMANSLYLCNERYTSRSWTRPVKDL